MKKLKLNVSDLQVESFDIEVKNRFSNGTAKGYGDTDTCLEPPCTSPVTCVYTCTAGCGQTANCTQDQTCGCQTQLITDCGFPCE